MRHTTKVVVGLSNNKNKKSSKKINRTLKTMSYCIHYYMIRKLQILGWGETLKKCKILYIFN